MSPVKHINALRVNFIMISHVDSVMKILRFFCCQVYVTGPRHFAHCFVTLMSGIHNTDGCD